MFARGEAEPSTATVAGAPPPADTAELLRACLRLLVLPHQDRVYCPRPPALWRVPDALERMRALLPTVGEGTDLVSFLPPPSEERAKSAVQRRAALATTLMAGLELGRVGVAYLNQVQAFGTITIRAERTGRLSNQTVTTRRSRPGKLFVPSAPSHE